MYSTVLYKCIAIALDFSIYMYMYVYNVHNTVLWCGVIRIVNHVPVNKGTYIYMYMCIRYWGECE